MQSARSAGILALAATLLGCGSSPPHDVTPESASSASSPSPDASGSASAAPDASAAPAASVAFDVPKAPAGDPGGAPGQASADSKAPLTGKISQQTISDLVIKNQDLFNDCYTIGAGKSKQFVATVTVKASIGPTGAVNLSQVTKSTAKNPKVDKCVADAFKKMAFPATGSTVPITFPMQFKGAEEVK